MLVGINEFIGEGDVYISFYIGLFVNSIDIVSLDISVGFVVVFNSDEVSWYFVEDYRGKIVYDVVFGDALFIFEFGSLSENFIWLSSGGEY